MAAAIERLLSEISESEEPIEELRCLSTAVSATPLSALRESLSPEKLGLIFSLLNTSDRQQVKVCVEILGRVLQVLDPVQLAQNCKLELQSGLNHPDDSVKVLGLQQISRVIGHSEGITEMLNSPEVLRDVIRCVGAERIGVAKEAISALSMLSNTKAGLDALFRSDLLKELKDVMGISDVIRYRVYELVVEVSSVSPVSLGYCANSSFISQLLEELTGEDVLVRVTAIEMVTSLAQSQHGRQYLAQQGIMDKISNMITAADSDPFSSFYLPGLVKFFGNLAVMDSPQQVCESYPAFLNMVFTMAMNPDPTQTPVALDTLGLLGGTVEGKQVLHKTGEQFKTVLKRMSLLATDDTTDLRVRSLEAIAQLLTLPLEQQTDDLLLLTESWFSLLSSKPMEMIRNISTQPFPELHCAALRIFTAIACQEWAQRLMMSTPGFAEWVVDRSVGKGKKAKDCKFELVGALLSSSSIREIFGAQNYLKLRAYLDEGPYYVSAVSTVTTEGAD
ncbi:26S proteasome non-ATPase regulatory subunit 5 [Astyanax mexicanus]|uniref:26S proteasome non-ATPase regulatory subunit 5 n=1 Tax=Astyanax mexicanus TaxID=7994 RepID=A0A8T2L7Q9_ASTMX|nr:26S proteasome non-ATPase regulatory subunit 5 [Astyanax mexicanus]KAG9266055.1 26S proteasome non-ATPase regulatory subunit 5 [Astyanax mexicanus]